MMQLNELNYLGDCSLATINATDPLFHSGSHRHYNDVRRSFRDKFMQALYNEGLHLVKDTGRDGRYNQSIKQLGCLVKENKALAIPIMNATIGDTITPYIVNKVVTKFNAQVALQKKQAQAAARPPRDQSGLDATETKNQPRTSGTNPPTTTSSDSQSGTLPVHTSTTTQPTQTPGSSTSQLSELVHSKYFIPVAAGAAGLILILLISR